MFFDGGHFSEFGNVGSGGSYPNPFYDIASLSIPTHFRSALHWCEYIFSLFGTYRAAIERIICYFVTDIDISEAVEEEKQKWLMLLKDKLDILIELQNILRDKMCYGNSFVSVIVPFSRWLECERCKTNFKFREVYSNKIFKFEWKMPNFVATCPKCQYRGRFEVRDREEDLENGVRIKRWSPHDIEIVHDLFTDSTEYYWRIPEHYKQQLRLGNPFHLERADLEVIKAVANNQLFKFNKDSIFHMKEPCLSGIINRGWGIPRTLTTFRQIWYMQVLRRYNEAIALDYVIPFRIITPPSPTGSTGVGQMPIDPLLFVNGNDFRAQVTNMIRKRRKDPASIQILPFPVQFQMFGADASRLAPRDLLEHGLDVLLSEVGIPVELYKGTLQLQSAPHALRLFESFWLHIVNDCNKFLDWLTFRLANVLSWEPVKVKLRKVTLADNIERQMLAVQLMMNQQLSPTSVLKELGFDWAQEQRQLAEEAQFQFKMQNRIQEEMEGSEIGKSLASMPLASMMAANMAGPPPGAAPPGGAPPPGGGGGMPPPPPPGGGGGPVTNYLMSVGPNVPQTPEDMIAVAESLAQQLLGSPESVKDSELRKLKQHNEVMHALVKSKMEQIRSQVRSQAGNTAVGQYQQQMSAGGQPPPPM
jgi:hypothetical protein